MAKKINVNIDKKGDEWIHDTLIGFENSFEGQGLFGSYADSINALYANVGTLYYEKPEYKNIAKNVVFGKPTEKREVESSSILMGSNKKEMKEEDIEKANSERRDAARTMYNGIVAYHVAKQKVESRSLISKILLFPRTIAEHFALKSLKEKTCQVMDITPDELDAADAHITQSERQIKEQQFVEEKVNDASERIPVDDKKLEQDLNLDEVQEKNDVDLEEQIQLEEPEKEAAV